MMIFQFCQSSHIYQMASCKEEFLPSLHYHLVSWILLLFSGLRSIIVIYLLKAKIVKIQPVGTHSVWFLCLFDMSHHFQSTYLLSGTTNVPFLPYTTKWLFLHIPLSGYSAMLYHGHWMCFELLDVIASVGALFIGQNKEIYLKKDALIFVIPIQYHKVLLSCSYLDLSSPTARIRVHNNINMCLFICPALQYT